MSDDSSDYKVGRGRPPKHTQFSKGRSGNPAGRPKGSKDVTKLVNDVFLRQVRVKGEDGKAYKISKLEAMVTQLANTAAMKGDPRAIKTAMEILRMFPAPPPIREEDKPPTFTIRFIDSDWDKDALAKKGLLVGEVVPDSASSEAYKDL